MNRLGLLLFRIGLYYPIRGEALMKEPFLESFSNTSCSLTKLFIQFISYQTEHFLCSFCHFKKPAIVGGYLSFPLPLGFF